MLHVRPTRTYKGQPAKTRLISNTTRVPATYLRPPATVNKPENSRLHQGGSAGVFRFEPDPTFVCCTARCMSHFENADDDRVVQARQPLYNSLLSVDDRRAHLRDNWKKKLLIDHHGQQRPVCLTCACKIYVCSRSKLCPQSRETGRSKAESNSARAKKNVSVGAWFYVLMETLDVMPDTGLYQLQCGRKHMLFENYSLDVACRPDLYMKCEKSHFYHVWRESFPNVKLRKHCRFAKCEFCIDKRDIISSPTMQELQKADARERLKLHLNWAHTRERGFYHSKRDEAIKCPQKKLSISIDGTDQFINGFPHFWEISKQDAKGKRFYFHTQVCLVHGVGPSTQARMTTAQFRYHVCAGPGALEQSPCSLVANGSWEKQARCTGVSGGTQTGKCSCSPSSPLTIRHGVKPSTRGRTTHLDPTAVSRKQASRVCCLRMWSWPRASHCRKHARRSSALHYRMLGFACRTQRGKRSRKCSN